MALQRRRALGHGPGDRLGRRLPALVELGPGPSRFLSISAAALTAAVLTACGGGDREADACRNDDGALNRAGFIFVQAPSSGDRVKSGFRVTGCSSTFEASVNWRLRSRNGEVIARGVTQGGSQEPSSFEFTVAYSIAAREIGELEVFEPRVTSEGFPPSKDFVPLVLEP